MSRIIRCILLLVLITLGNGFLFSGLTVRAAEEEQIELDETPQIELDETPVENEYVPDVDDQDPSRLFNGYAEKVFHDQVRMKSGRKLAPRNNASKLKGMNLQVYTRLYEGICAVAAGERESTVFTVELSDLDIQTSWTAEELGVSSLITETDSGKVISAEAKEAVKNLLGLDVPLVIRTLMSDCPYELYWYDKTGNMKWTEYGFSLKGSVLSIKGPLEFKFPVSTDYAQDLYMTDSSSGAAVQNAKDTALGIVEDNEGKEDFDRLDAYRETICGLVSYDDAAFDQDTDYGNPWQIIWVFDENPDTNVVCEGYAKAFQYLCDLSTFEQEITACSVTGSFNGVSHMWNLVQMEDGRNYLVDLTNCDTNTVGEPDFLFLTGTANGTADTAYTFIAPSGDRIVYQYDEDTRSVYDNSELVLSERSYTGKYDGDEEACAQGHDYQLDGWLWKEDRSSADAVFVCSRNNRHTCTVSADVTSEMNVQKGGTVCTAVVSEENSPDHIRHETSITISYTGWYTSPDNKKYYFNPHGGLSKGWLSIENNWYYFDVEGVMQTGWKLLGGKWYYLKSSGAMATGWTKVGGKWYWMDSSGAMAEDSLIFSYNSSGDVEEMYYVGTDGVMVTNKWVYYEFDDGTAYWLHFDGEGKLDNAEYA